MIRNAVIHLVGEQPLVADLFELPKSGDISLVCTNVRTLDGRRPVFIDQKESLFVFPYLTIKFLEVLPGSTGIPEIDAAARQPGAPPPETEPAEADEELDEDFLRRIREA